VGLHDDEIRIDNLAKILRPSNLTAQTTALPGFALKSDPSKSLSEIECRFFPCRNKCGFFRWTESESRQTNARYAD
jgi:hypothetical protein